MDTLISIKAIELETLGTELLTLFIHGNVGAKLVPLKQTILLQNRELRCVRNLV